MKLKLVIKALILKFIDRVLVNDLYMAYNGDNLYFTLWDLDNNFFRHHLKYNPDNLSEEQLDILEKGRDKLYELLEKYNVDFDHVE